MRGVYKSSESEPDPDGRRNAEFVYTKAHQAKLQKSIEKTIERYTGILAVIQTWEKAKEPDYQYLKTLHTKATKLRAQLKVKGIL